MVRTHILKSHKYLHTLIQYFFRHILTLYVKYQHHSNTHEHREMYPSIETFVLRSEMFLKQTCRKT